jgi:hypothetical protein
LSINKKIMKHIFSVLAAILINISIWAQSPEKMSYQAVIRNANYALLANQNVGMQISILQGSASGIVVYKETQTPTTNINGLISINIGEGNVMSGNFSTIDWGNHTYFIMTETDPTGGNDYSITSTSQLLSVPYALHAKTAANVPEGYNPGDMQYWNGNAWVTIEATENERATLQMIGGIPTWVGGMPPVKISRPFADYTYMVGEVELQCSTDNDNIASIEWTSSIDGSIGSGTEATAELTAGSHVITVTATDTEGESVTDIVNIEVVSGPITLEVMIDWMVGSYSSANQAATSSDPYHVDVRRHTALIWDERTDGYWLYLEQAYADDLENPYFQRIYNFYEEEGVIKNTIYSLLDPDPFVGSWATPEDFDALTLEDLEERTNCGLTFDVNNDHVYGTTSGTSCLSSSSYISYFTSEQWIYQTQWNSWDLGYNDQGVIVMGPYSPYIFDKVNKQ